MENGIRGTRQEVRLQDGIESFQQAGSTRRLTVARDPHREAVEKSIPTNHHSPDAKGPPGELAGLSNMSAKAGQWALSYIYRLVQSALKIGSQNL